MTQPQSVSGPCLARVEGWPNPGRQRYVKETLENLKVDPHRILTPPVTARFFKMPGLGRGGGVQCFLSLCCPPRERRDNATQPEHRRLTLGSALFVVPLLLLAACGGGGGSTEKLGGGGTMPPGQNPGTQNPGTQNPGTQNPGTQNPGTQNPGTQNPGTQNPGTQNPGTQNPGTAACTVGGTVSPGNACSHASSGNNFTFTVRPDGTGCIGGSICSGRSIVANNFSARRNNDGSWEVVALPGTAGSGTQNPGTSPAEPGTQNPGTTAFGLNPTQAGYAATAVSQAAQAIPRAGSVTQSSNVNNNGVTLDRVSVTVQHGTSRNSYSIRNGSSWSISTSDGNPISAPDGSQELSKRTNGGMLYVDVYSDIEAPQTTTTPTVVPGQSQNVVAGDRINGVTCFGPNCTPDTQKGTLNGVQGTFSCPSGCTIKIGNISLSSGSTINLPGGTINGITFGIDEITLTSTTGIQFTPEGTTRPSEQTTPDTDYLAGGVWLFVPDDAVSADNFEMGAFGDGSDPFQQSNLMALQGTARYAGLATGIYSVRSQEEGNYIGWWDSAVSLTANFSGSSDLGTISGSLSNIKEWETNYLFSGTVTLGTANIGSSNSGFFEGRLNGTVDGHNFAGRWGGQFFGNGEADGRPGSVGGTLGGTSNDENRSFVGVFGAYKE